MLGGAGLDGCGDGGASGVPGGGGVGGGDSGGGGAGEGGGGLPGGGLAGGALGEGGSQGGGGRSEGGGGGGGVAGMDSGLLGGLGGGGGGGEGGRPITIPPGAAQRRPHNETSMGAIALGGSGRRIWIGWDVFPIWISAPSASRTTMAVVESPPPPCTSIAYDRREACRIRDSGESQISIKQMSYA